MKIKIERGKKRYEVVPCGRRCSYYKPYSECDFCIKTCRVPKWWKSKEISAHDGFEGLREIGMSQFDKSKERTK